MNTELILVILSSIVLVSYLFDIFSSRIKLPSVVLLLGSGLALRVLSRWTGYDIPYIDRVLAPLGTVGLILIVLEAGLDLGLNLDKLALIKKSLLSAFSGLIFCLLGIAGFYSLIFEVPFRICLLNALPFAVISSAIAIPGSKLLNRERHEFVTYESSFSDILGILVFNFLLLNGSFGFSSLFSFSFEIFATILLSIFFSLALTKLIEKINHPVKHLPLFAIILLVYATAKAMHFSPLILVLIFGLLLNNVTLVVRGNMRKYLDLAKLQDEVRQFKSIIYEATFVIKTFFFVLLGYSVNLHKLLDREALAIVLPVMLVIYSSRALFQRGIMRALDAAALSYVAPRGLITILLFMSIPAGMRIELIPDSVLLWVIFLTSLVMAWGVAKHSGGQGAAQELKPGSEETTAP